MSKTLSPPIPTTRRLQPLVVDPMELMARRRRWTRKDSDFLQRSGLFDGERYELIDGELVSLMSLGRRHVFVVEEVSGWLKNTFDRRTVQIQGPIDVRPEDNPTNEPEPDAAVFSAPLRSFLQNNPRPSDVALLVEVADSTRLFDLGTKAKLYARAGIAEYWVVDIPERAIVVHRDPTDIEDGKYEHVTPHNEAKTIACLVKPNAFVRVADLLPPADMEE